MTDATASGAGSQGEPPGWYPDPWERADERWWNGYEWSDQTRANPAQQLPAEGWYDDPNDGTVERWWDGQQWSSYTRARAGGGTADSKVASQPDAKSTAGSDWAERNGARLLGALLVLGILVVVISSLGGSSEDRSPTEPSIEGSSIGAYLACQDFTERILRAPSTARFPSHREATITTQGSQWVVEAYVDAENAFGAMIRSEWRCTASRSGDTWTGQSTLLE